ncbi:MAG: radical SAM protein [Deltaproteobacteria bacterium]|nr:radical SAM protein [Deltaproteobacteria bacterium]
MAAPRKSYLSDFRPKWTRPGGKPERTSRRTGYRLSNFTRAYRSWIGPYIKSRLHSGEFRPVLSFLYTDLNCNLDCHYCYSRGRRIPGMTMEVAKRSVDWLSSVGCKVLAYMGGEPLVRKDVILELTRYATERGFFVYLPTNGILLDEAFIDEIGKAGISTINLAVDSMEGADGIPKCFARIRRQFDWLLEREEEYGFITFLNINITDRNIGDIKALTELAHDHGVPTDYHINEPPLIQYDQYRHVHDGAWITEGSYLGVDALIDWLIEKNLAGYTMVNSVEHLRAMKRFIRHELPPWPCCAGRLTLIIRLDGTLAPCFELYGSKEDWGSVENGPRFDPLRLARIKDECTSHCLSTCNYQVMHYTRSLLYSLQWIAKHAQAHLFGVS